MFRRLPRFALSFVLAFTLTTLAHAAVPVGDRSEADLYVLMSDARVIAQLSRAVALGYRLDSVTGEAQGAGTTVHKLFYHSIKPEDGTVGAFDVTVVVKQGHAAVTRVTRFLTFQ